MLNDLEKRRAFLEKDQDTILDGLYSAYDLELTNKNPAINPLRIILMLALTICLLIVAWTLFFASNFWGTITVDEVQFEKVHQKPVVEKEPVKAEQPEVKRIAETKGFLRLDDDLVLKNTDNEKIATTSNIIESIKFEKSSNGINLVMQTPLDIDYLVYGLSNPARTVLEVENADLGFPLEQLEPVEPIVAIRYSINEYKRFKLVLETDKPLLIRKSTTNHSNDKHSLVVTMDYQWDEGVVTDEAEEVLSEIVDLQVQSEKNTVYKGELIKTPVGQNDNAYAEKLFQQAYTLYKSGDISRSLKMLNMTLDHDAGHVNARSTLALILSQQGHTELAYSVLNEGLIQYPDQIEWIKMTARLLLNEGKIIEAKNLLAKQTPPLTVNTDYYALKAAILQKLNDHNESARIYRDLLQVNPVNSVWWMGLGISLESMSRYDDALYAYQKAFNDPALTSDSKAFVSQRLTMLSNLLKDEST